MLDPHELETFLTLAEELHFGHTAQRLHMSTARVSQIVRKLERQIGVPLFGRTSRRVELSPTGRQLYDQLQPAWATIATALNQAIEASRGYTATLRICFVGAAAGQLLLRAVELFQSRHPECDVRIREAQLGELMPWLRHGEVDLVLAALPVHETGIATGPVLVSEARFLAVPAGHPLTHHHVLSVEDLAQLTILQLPDTLPQSLRADHTPESTPAGRPIHQGPVGATLQELLTLVGAGRGVFPVGAHIRRYYPRPDVTYIHLHDSPPLEWGLLWRVDSASARIHAFVRAAQDLLSSHE